MTTQIKRRRGTTTQHASFTGAEGELTIDTTKDTVVVHDGITSGGHPLAKESSITGKVDKAGDTMTGDLTVPNVIVSGNVDGRDVSADGTKLDTIETNADVTDTTNVTAAGALMTTGGTMTGDVAYGDNDKAIFGAGSDLQIYHDGASGQSIIHENGPSVLKIRASDFRISNADNTADYLSANDGAEVSIRYNGAPKLATTSTGVDITGTITADDHVYIEGNAARLSFGENDTTDLNTRFSLQSGSFRVETVNDSFASAANRISVDNSTGDISFYEDTGTTPKFFWDASAESLGIGTSSLSSYAVQDLVIANTGNNVGITIQSDTAGMGKIHFADGTTGSELYRGVVRYQHSSDTMDFWTGGVAKMTIDSSGNVGIGTSSPAGYKLHVADGTPTVRISGTAETAGLSQYVTFGTPSYNRSAIQSTNVGTQGADLKFLTAPSGGNSTERMRIDSSGKVGIGTSSPYASSTLSVAGPVAGRSTGVDGTFANVFNATYSGNTTQFGSIQHSMSSIATSSGFRFLGGGAGGGGTTQEKLLDLTRGQTIFYTGDTERMRIDSSGNVGIGTSSPASLLHLSSASDTYFTIGTTNATADARIQFRNSGGTDAGGLWYTTSGNNMLFRTNSAERMRIDNSGNLLVGKTTNGSSVTGCELRSEGFVIASMDGDHAAVFDRKTSNGVIVQLRKDNTTVGSIGSVAGSYLSIGQGDTGILFQDDNDFIEPCNVSTSTGRDAAIDLGTAGGRFKDLYLSGGVYLGGTGAANHLDDYEEGTHQVTVTSTTGTPTISSTEDALSYTKIGNQVFINGQLGSVNCVGCSGDLFITLPFVTETLTERSDFYFAHAHTNTGNSISYFTLTQAGGGSSTFEVGARMTDGTNNSNVATLLASAGVFDINIASMHYKTSS